MKKKYIVKISIGDNITLKNDCKIELGEKIIFNVTDGTSIVAPIINSFIEENSNLIAINCELPKHIYDSFTEGDKELDWTDFSLEKCIINGVDYLDSYLCA